MYIADLNTFTYDGMICFILQINHLLAIVTERDRPFILCTTICSRRLITFCMWLVQGAAECGFQLESRNATEMDIYVQVEENFNYVILF